jgi:hypothetical protein
MKLIACGCSYTDKNYIKNLLVSYKIKQPTMWPQLLQRQILCNSYNLAASGNTNEEIFSSANQGFLKHNPQVIIISLTEWSRIYIPGYGTLNPVFVNDIVNFVKGQPNAEFESIGKDKIINMYNVIEDIGLYNYADKIKKIMSDTHYINTVVNNLFEKIFLLLELCKSNNVKILVAQLVNPYPLWFTNKGTLHKLENAVINSPYTAYLNAHKEQLIGWPFLPSLDGWNYDYQRDMYDKDKLTWTHASDRHPNQLGQQQIANIYYENYNNVYKN